MILPQFNMICPMKLKNQNLMDLEAVGVGVVAGGLGLRSNNLYVED